jgi:hypothetical protein
MNAQEYPRHCIYWTNGTWARRQRDLNRTDTAYFWHRDAGRGLRLGKGGRFFMATPRPRSGLTNLVLSGRAHYDGAAIVTSQGRQVAVAQLWERYGVASGARDERELRALITETLRQRPDAPLELLILTEVEWLATPVPLPARFWKSAGVLVAQNPCRMLEPNLGLELEDLYNEHAARAAACTDEAISQRLGVDAR